MANIVEVPIAEGFYVSDSLPISNQECVNLIPVKSPESALSKGQLIGSSGIIEVDSSGSLPTNANRGAHDLSGVPYFVNGSSLYRLEVSYVAGVEQFVLVNAAPGGTIEGEERVSMADNGTQLMILVPGGEGYIYTESSGLQVIGSNFRASGNPQQTVFVDGYFVCTTDTKAWIISNLNDGTTWDALDFGTAESDPDFIVAPVVFANQIRMLGSETTEGFQNIGGSGFPFQRSNVFLDKGCHAPFSVINSNQQYFMIGGGKNERSAVWAYTNGGYVRISTDPIDTIINSYSRISLQETFALSWASRGQYFVAFSLPDRAFIYNITTGLWSELKSSIENSVGDLEQRRWRVASLVSAYGRVFVGDRIDGRIGLLDEGVYQEYGNDIVRIFSTLPLHNRSNSFRVPRIELTMESGVGNGVPDPAVTMAISEDSKTFSYERLRRIGRIGDYKHRVIWRKNGRMPRFVVFRFRISDPIKVVIIKLEVSVTR